jgi:hypothetical protein
MVQGGNVLYGTTLAGGTSGNGTVFNFVLPVPTLQPAISPNGQKLVLNWQTNALGMTLQSCTNLAAPVWIPVSSGGSLMNAQTTATNPVAHRHEFFRLTQ